ncbi:hypothetical protein SD81_035150 [Tolypothrix campylonemoides VB511288]|nr:hypothetical protein SD81_035150 [Tolypothrix campylonemoides VB511288]
MGVKLANFRGDFSGGWQIFTRLDPTDNVVEWMLLKLKKLPEVTQQILRLADCVGAEFDLDTLSIVCEKSPKTVFLDLLPAIQGGLIQPLSELNKDAKPNELLSAIQFVTNVDSKSRLYFSGLLFYSRVNFCNIILQ